MKHEPDGNNDSWVRAYREASALDERRPDPSVGDAVRTHARLLSHAQVTQRADAVKPDRMAGVAANAGRWKLSMLGSLAVVGLVGLLVLQFDQVGSPQEKDLVHGSGVLRSAGTDKTVIADHAVRPANDSAKPVTRDTQVAQPAEHAQAAQPPAPAPAPAPAPPTMRKSAAKASVSEAEPRAAAEADAAPGAPAAMESSRMAAARPVPGAIDADNDMHRLAAEGRWNAFAQRLAQGVPIDIRDARGRTPLMQAAAAGQRQMVQRLLQAGAEPTLMDLAGKTARQLAIDAGQADVVRLLPSDAQAGQIGR